MVVVVSAAAAGWTKAEELSALKWTDAITVVFSRKFVASSAI